MGRSDRPVGDNGLGFTTEQAAVEIKSLLRLFALLPESPLFEEWRELVVKFRVSGKNTHDARLVAAMRVHGLRSILTFNNQDFTRYADITVLDPKNLA